MRKYLTGLVLSILCSCTTSELNILDDQCHKTLNACIETKASLKTVDLPNTYNFDVKLSDAEIVARKYSSERTLIDLIPYDYDGCVLFYVAQYDKGYKIISGDKRTAVFLMESNDGIFEFDKESEFDGPSFWLTDLASEIYLLKKGCADVQDGSNVLFWDVVTGDNLLHLGNTPEIMSHVDSIDFEDEEHVWVQCPICSYDNTYYTNTTEHLLETRWGQWEPWNSYVPHAGSGNHVHCPTGCSAVAMAQILYFSHYNLNKPDWLYHDAQISGISYSDDNYAVTYTPGTLVTNSPRWGDMAIDNYHYWIGDNPDYVGQLMADVGYRIGMVYAPDGSRAFVSKNGFSQYDLCCDSSAYNQSVVESCIRSDKPVVITAYTDRSWLFGYHYSGGHTWVIDGFTTQQIDHTDVYEWRRLSEVESDQYFMYTEDQALSLDPDLYSGKRIIVTTSASSSYFKMNWGWDGSHDDELFGVGANIWTTVDQDEDGNDVEYDYRYNKTIWYDFR